MENKALAKTEREKTIKQHTDDLLYQYDILKILYKDIMDEDDWQLLKEAVVYHDLGKINSKFQNKLYRILKYNEFLPELDDNEEIPHNFLSPVFIDTKEFEEKYGLTKTKILVSAVYYHHNRDKKPISKNDIEDIKKQAKYIGIDKDKINPCFRKYLLSPDCEEDIEILESKEYIQIKGLLNRLDYVASLDKKDVNVEEEVTQNGETVADIINGKFKDSFREVQKYMLENEENNLVVISYTGSGKTEAALLWIGNNKAFYTLPLKVSINAMYKKINNDIKYNKALLLHSDAYSYYKNQNELIKYDRAKRMSAPLIVTTVDQIFKIAFKYTGYEEILSTLSYSKIVIDEIQMYSPELLAYILLGLSMITKVGGKFAIITATFPPVLYNIMDYLKIPYVKQTQEFTPHIMNRHKIQISNEEEFNFEKIKEISKHKKVLIIANTVKRAQAIYESLSESNVHLLHSHYIKEDRDILENNILEFGNRDKNDKTGIWVSTQIVEASLDIDFDILFTEMCSIDSLFQRMGRVFRKRLYQSEEPNVVILNNRNGVPYIIDSDIYDYTLRELEKYNNKNISETDKQNMIKNIFSLEKNKELKESKYYKKIRKTIQMMEDIRPSQADKEEISDKFRDIQNVSLIPDNIYENLYSEGKIDIWNNILQSNTSYLSEKIQVKDEIRKYVVNVRWSRKLDIDKEELFYKGSNIYRTRYTYEFDKNSKRGLGLIMKNMHNTGYFDE